MIIQQNTDGTYTVKSARRLKFNSLVDAIAAVRRMGHCPILKL